MKSLVQAAIRARAGAYAPYSHFTVGAAVLGSSGKTYTGANVENASYGASMCAERCAIFAAVNAGERRIDAIAVTATPCGMCRQVLREFADPEALQVLVVETEDSYRKFTLSELLPESFGPEQLASASGPIVTPMVE